MSYVLGAKGDRASDRPRWENKIIKQENEMTIREFDAHEWKKKPSKVSFKTKDGEKVQFVARKEKRVPVHVRFKTGRRKSS